MQLPGALMPAKLRPIGFESQLSIVDHLDELRTRLIVSLLTVVVAFGITFSQNHSSCT